MIKKRFVAGLLCALSLALVPVGRADTVTLKSGEKIEGKVVQETDQEVTIEYHVSASITDSRTIPKAEIESVAKATPDELLFQSLQALKPGPNSFPADYYPKAVKSLQDFLTQYPKSPHADEIARQLAAFADEKSKVDGGEIKIATRWLRKEEAMRERYQITAQLLYAQMEDAARRSDLATAMNTFDQIEKGYPGSRSMPDAVELARKILPSLKTMAERALLNLKAQKADREKGLKLLSDNERTQTIAALAHEEKQNNDAFEAAGKAGVKWGPMQIHGEKSLTQIATKAPTEESRLAALPVPKMRDSLRLTDTGLQQFAQQDYTAAQGTFREATAAWSANEIATRYTKDVAEKLAPKATPEPIVPVATPTGTPTPKPTSTPQVAHAATPAPSAPIVQAPIEEEPSFFRTPKGIIIIVVAVIALLGGAYQLKKKKQSDGDVE